MSKKIGLVIMLMALYGITGSLQRGWFDWMGLMALSALIIPMTVTWIKEGGNE